MAISLTKPQAAYRAWVMAANGLDEVTAGIFLSDVEELVDEAVGVMCDKVIEAGEWERLQTSSSVGLASGQGTLPDATIPKTVKPSLGGQVTSASFAYPLIYLDNLRDLYLPKPGQSKYGFYTVRGGNSSGGIIYCYNADGTVLTGSVTVLACAYQTFATLAPEFEEEYLITLADLARAKRMQ